MHGKYPVSVVTDGDKAMSKALSSVMPSTVHRLCFWHLERNVQTNIGDTGFTQAFTDCMLTYMTKSEFETQWLKAIGTFGLQRNDWVKMMYCKQKLWAETFLRGTFFGGLRSTQRSESINSFLNKFLHRRLKLYDFMSHIDRAMLRLRNNELKDDFDTINEHPVLVTHLLQLEKYSAEVYTQNTFHWVRDEIKSEAKHSILNCVDDMDCVLYTFQKFAGGDKTWNCHESHEPTPHTRDTHNAALDKECEGYLISRIVFYRDYSKHNVNCQVADVVLPDPTTVPIDRNLILWNTRLLNYWKTSPYYLEENVGKSEL
ncbi:hypothetical protein LWI29_019863 [Acer saccharum]|uniref:MULE transposase domain-containing protein n=1 Tax=Acer saccharum TaxID=4024 RepID=A0AA39ST91_ACESA|nr:hypothetical protein LWI29_019863 [Acer saccharum]